VKLIIGSDHGGFKAKELLIRALREEGHAITDVGIFDEESVDYPDIAKAVGQAVAGGKAARGILLCGTGIGMSIAANKIRGIRAAVAWDINTAGLAAEHNNANILCLGGRVLKPSAIKTAARTWLRTPFAKGRHLHRTMKISALEKGKTRVEK
jgi:ribose 5-phosphate isomerase B